MILLKSTGIVRKVDELGRIVLDIAERDALEIFVSEDTIMLKKYQPACVFCNSSKGIVSYKGKNICTSCINTLTDRT